MSIIQVGCWILAVIMAPVSVWLFIELLPGFAKDCLEDCMDKDKGILERYSMAVIGVGSIACVTLIPLLLYSKLIPTALGK